MKNSEGLETMTMRNMISILIIAAGPIATLYPRMIVYARATDKLAIFYLMVSVLALSATTAAVSTATNLILRRIWLATVVSVIISEATYVVLLLIYVCVFSSGFERTESLAWLPMIIRYLIPVGLPIAISVSYGTGRIVKDWRELREREESRSRDFVKQLIENDGKRCSTDKQ
jgi:hypothetical protein